MADLVPQLARLQGLVRLAVGAAGQLPVAVVLDPLEKIVGDAHRVVRVLAGDGEIGFRFPVGVVGAEVDLGVALAGELDDPLDVIVRHHRRGARADFALQGRVLRPGRSNRRPSPSQFDAGAHEPVQVLR